METGNDILNSFVAVFFSSAGVSSPGVILFNLMDFVCSLAGDGIANGVSAAGAAAWAQGLINEGIWGGVAGVLSFIPQILFLFLLLSILEDSGYMARVAFISTALSANSGFRAGRSFP